ncbi:MAG: MFS transporter [Opitutaceae bacterium]
MARPIEAIRQWNRDFTLLAVAVFSVGLFFGVQLTLFNNFIVDRLQIEADQLGVIEALREVPGFLNALIIAVLAGLAAPLFAGLSLILMGGGLMAYAVVDNVYSLAIFSVIWSIGFHAWIPLEQSMALQFSPGQTKGRWLGQLRAVASVGWLLAIGLCLGFYRFIGYNGLFIMAGGVTMVGGLTIFFASRRRVTGEKSFVFRRRYTVYYLLQFLQGCRKQMFITFAIFALVKVHGMPITTTMVLVLINQILVTLTGPTVGRWVDRFGERRMLSWSYLGLILVFTGYATVTHRPTLYVLYCLDNVIFFGGIALTTYLYKIAPSEDLKPTLSMGVTMNHAAAVTAPLVGGFVWYYFGYEVIFYAGAALAFVSLIVSQWVRPEKAAVSETGVPAVA